MCTCKIHFEAPIFMRIAPSCFEEFFILSVYGFANVLSIKFEINLTQNCFVRLAFIIHLIINLMSIFRHVFRVFVCFSMKLI